MLKKYFELLGGIILKKAVVIFCLIITVVIILSSCASKIGTVEGLDVEKILNERFNNTLPIWKVDKILKETSINDKEYIIFYFNRKQGINIARIALINKKWKVFVATHEKPEEDVITWSWSSLCNLSVEKDYEIGAVTSGYINDEKVTKVVVGIKGKEETYKQAEIIEFDLNDKKLKMYYYLHKDATGFERNVIAYDKNGNVLLSNKP